MKITIIIENIRVGPDEYYPLQEQGEKHDDIQQTKLEPGKQKVEVNSVYSDKVCKVCNKRYTPTCSRSKTCSVA